MMRPKPKPSAPHVKTLQDIAAAERRLEIRHERRRLAELARAAGVDPDWREKTHSDGQAKEPAPRVWSPSSRGESDG